MVAAWQEVETELEKFEGPNGFDAPCTMAIAVGRKA
jgi:hypothetical protein